MRFCPLALVAVQLIATSAPGQTIADYDRHILFDNSAAREAYYHSAASVVAPSELAIVGGKCPVDSAKFVSPPNSLRISWTSATGGDWRVSLKTISRYGRRFEFDGDMLVLRCYSEEGLAVDDSPRIGVRDVRERARPDIPLLSLHGPLPAGEWVELRLPFDEFKGQYQSTEEFEFDPRRLASIELVQGLDDARPHMLYIDDVRIVDEDEVADKEPPPAPEGLVVEGHDSHIDLAWTAGKDEDVAAYRVYRSWDGETFEPIATRPARYRRCTDHVGVSGKTAHYKVTALDLYGNESPASAVASGETRAYSDDELLDMVQKACFRYYWEAANKDSGMALEILPGDENLIALGASGFGIMAQLAATERGFISRDESVERMVKIVRFLARAERFHGVWPHFIDGRTAGVNAYFGRYDNGGDLVETAFLMQGLLAARQYFTGDNPSEREIRDTITRLWREVEWDWYRKDPDSDVLYWHWSPTHDWHISHPLIGWNETLIVYLLAIASPTHGVPASMYHTGWAGQSDFAVEYRRNWSRTTQGDHFTNGNKYYGIPLEVGVGNGSELFFTQFSFLGFDPRGKRDRYTNYFKNNRNIALISHAYSIENPLGRKGYGPDCWGRSAGIQSGGGRAQPRDDNGTICCSAALGCFPYTPEESLAALKHFYRKLGPQCWGVYGFHDGFNETEQWFDEGYMGLNQAQIVVGIENHRTGLLWKLFMANAEIEPALKAIGFEPDEDD